MAKAPDEVGTGLAFITAPPEEFVPEPVRGQPVIGIVCCYAGSVEDGEEALRTLRELPYLGLDLVQPMPYVDVQQLLDPPNPKGMQNYWTADFFSDLPDEAIDVLVSHATNPVSPLTQIIVIPEEAPFPGSTRTPPPSGSETHPGTSTTCRCGPIRPTTRRTSRTHARSPRR